MRASCIILLIALLAAGCAPTPAPAATVAPAEPLSVGLDMLDPPESDAVYDLAQATGAGWVRYPLRWNELEPRRREPARYRWRAYDPILEELHARGFQVILTVRDNPGWAAETICGPLNEEGVPAFAEMLSAAVERYAVEPYGVKHWELYNEPDNRAAEFTSQGGCWGDAPAKYAELLRIAYRAIKTADPGATVIFGGLALEKLEGDPFNVAFLEQTLAAGAGEHFDWMNFHYYPAFSYRWDDFGAGIAGKAAYVRDVMLQAGVDRPLMCGEIGQPNVGPDAEGYSDEKTMALVYQELARAAPARLEAVIWHKLLDRPGEERLYGLVAPDEQPKPAYGAFQSLVRALEGARFVGTLGEEEAGSSDMEGYRFRLDGEPSGTLLIAWSKADTKRTTLTISAASVSVIDSAGRETVIQDGDAGDANRQANKIGVDVSHGPVMIRYAGPGPQ